MTRAPELSAADLDALAGHAREIAVACGRLVRDERPADLAVATKSTATDVVTVMDRRSEDLARREVALRRPADAFFGEEGVTAAGTTGITWVVDPIDGTVNYLYDLPAYVVSVAAVEGNPREPGAWRPVAGAVYNPVLEELFWARRGGGAWLTRGAAQPVPLRCGAVAPFAEALVATGFAYDAAQRAVQGEIVARLLPHVRDIRRFGAAALDMCHVAAGRVDAYFEQGLHPWDIAGAWIIADEAGLVVQGLGVPHPTPEMTLVGPASLVAGLERLLRDNPRRES